MKLHYIGGLAASVILMKTGLLTNDAIAQLVTPSPTVLVFPQSPEPRTAPPGTRSERPKTIPRSGASTPSPTPAAKPRKSPALPLADRDPNLSDLDAILGSSTNPLPVHVCFASSVELTDVQIAQGAALIQALGLHAGYRPLVTSYGSEVVREKFNVIIGPVDQVRNFISDQEAKKITKGYVAIQRLQNGAKNDFVLLVTGHTPEDVDTTVLSLGFVQVRFPDSPSVTIRQVNLPAVPVFLRQSPLEADKTLTFAELQERGATVRPLPSGGVSLDLFFPGYFRTDSDAQVTINLHYSLQERAFHSAGSIAIRLNDHEISTSQSAARPSAAGGTECSLTLPLRMFQHGRNLLEITTSGTPSATPRNDDLRVFADSELVMPKIETGPKLPDLRLVSQTFYPFIGQPDGSDLAVLLPDRNQETINAVWTLLSRLAQSANTLLYAAQLTFDQYDSRRHVLVVGTYDHLPAAFRNIVALRAFNEAHINVPLAELDSLSTGTNLKQLIERLLDQRRERMEELNEKVRIANLPQVNISDRDFGVLATAPPPSAGHGWSLVVTGFTSENVLRRVQSLVQDPFWTQVRGDIDRWQDLPASFQAHVPGEAHENASATTLVELPLGERIEFRVWVGIVAGTLTIFVVITSRLLGKFDEALVLRQRRPK
jgi:Bacterial cellulose synthase subunit